MPPVSRFGGGNRAQKKQTIIEKLKAFFERVFGISGGYNNQLEEPDVRYLDALEDYQPPELLAAEDGKKEYTGS